MTTHSSTSTPVIKTGYESFGSFMSQDPMELLSKPQTMDIFRKVSLLDPETFEMISNFDQSIQSLDDIQFPINVKEWTFLNHGAFGSPFSSILSISNTIRNSIESQPLKFLDRDLFSLLSLSIQTLAKYLKVNPFSLFLTESATTSLNTVFRYLSDSDTPEHPHFFLMDLEYGSTKKMMKFYKFQHSILAISLPLSKDTRKSFSDRYLQMVRNSVNSLSPQKITPIFILDHITSNSAILIPIKEISKSLKREYPHCIIIIDGAHSLGMIDVDLSSLSAIDFYLGNCHKWLCNPRGCGFLYHHQQQQSSPNPKPIQPLVCSHGYGSQKGIPFLWTGNRDYSSMVTLSITLALWNSKNVSFHRVWSKLTKLMNQGIKTLWWNPEYLVNSEFRLGFFTIISLPDLPGVNITQYDESIESFPKNTSTEAKYLQDVLHHSFKIEIPVKVWKGSLWLRISVHLYNNVSDFETLGKAILDLSTSLSTGKLDNCQVK